MHKFDSIYKLFTNKVLIVLLILSYILQGSFLQELCNVYNIKSVRFWHQFSIAFYGGMAINVGCFALFYIFSLKRNILRTLLFASILANIVFYFSIDDKIAPVSTFLGEILIHSALPFNFVKVAVHEEILVWSIPVAFYIGVFLIIYGYFFVKKSLDYKSIFERKITYMGFGVYLCVLPFVFFVTHFTSVGSYYQYGLNELLFTNKMVKSYELKNQHENFQLKELHWFATKKDALDFYTKPTFIEKIDIQDNKNKKRFYERSVSLLKNNIDNGWNTMEPDKKYQDIEEFDEWIQFAYNFKFSGSSKAEKSLWLYNIIPLAKENKKIAQESGRTAIFFLHESKTEGFYARLIFERAFKDNRANLIFNYIFILYHFVFFTAFYFLLKTHNKKLSPKKENINV
jgi:hypothetical protein